MKDIYELRNAYYKKNPDGHYFDADTLKFFGERFSDMKLLKGTSKITDICGEVHEVYTISRLQRNHPNGAQRTHAYFDINTLDDVIL
jgi:hypothetical protein